MNKPGKLLLEVLRGKFSVRNNFALSKKLGTNPAKLSNWEKSNLASKTVLKNVINLLINKYNGEDFIAYLKKRLNISKDSKVAKVIGVTAAALNNWRSNGIPFRSMFDIIKKAQDRKTTASILPIVEFYRVDRTETKQGRALKLLNRKTKKALVNKLSTANGIYIFHNSQGNAIYVGKAKSQSLWQEMNNAFNRKRGDSQVVKKIKRPKNKDYKETTEKSRQIKKQCVHMHEIVSYFSAYSVEKPFINNFEAAIIRMFPNDLINSKTEKIRI